MRKLKLFFMFACMCFIHLSATSVLTSTYYYNGFDESIVSDGNAEIKGFSTNNIFQHESVLNVDVAVAILYNKVLTLTFSETLDLSRNAIVKAGGICDSLKLSDSLPEGVSLVLRLLITLYDEDNNRTGGDQQVYSFGLPMNGETWTERVLDLKTYPGSVDFTKIKKLVLVFQAPQSMPLGAYFTSGTFKFNKIELGEPAQSSILTYNSFLNEFTFLN